MEIWYARAVIWVVSSDLRLLNEQIHRNVKFQFLPSSSIVAPPMQEICIKPKLHIIYRGAAVKQHCSCIVPLSASSVASSSSRCRLCIKLWWSCMSFPMTRSSMLGTCSFKTFVLRRLLGNRQRRTEPLLAWWWCDWFASPLRLARSSGARLGGHQPGHGETSFIC